MTLCCERDDEDDEKKSYIPKPPLHMANSNLIIPIYRSAIKKVADYCVNVIEPVEEELIKVKRR